MIKYTVCYTDLKDNDIEITFEAKNERAALEKVLNEQGHNLKEIFDVVEHKRIYKKSNNGLT